MRELPISKARRDKCVTHHRGCDCREYRLQRAEAEVARLRGAIMRTLTQSIDPLPARATKPLREALQPPTGTLADTAPDAGKSCAVCAEGDQPDEPCPLCSKPLRPFTEDEHGYFHFTDPAPADRSPTVGDCSACDKPVYEHEDWSVLHDECVADRPEPSEALEAFERVTDPEPPYGDGSGYNFGDDYQKVRQSISQPVPAVPDILERESWGLVPVSVPTGGDDYDVEWHVIEYHMAEPHERIIGRGRTAQEAISEAATPAGEQT